MVDKKNPKLGGRFNVDDAIRIMDDIPESKVKKAYKLARDRKKTGRLNVDDVERALGTINDKTRKAKSSMTSDKAYAVKKNMGGSMGGGMNPMGRSPDPTVQSVTGYNPSIRRRGGGIAKRGMGKAK